MVFDVDWGRYKLVDLTRTIVAGGGSEDVKVSRGRLPNGTFYSELAALSSHVGTHVELPGHFYEDGKTLPEFPLTAFMGRGVLAPIRELQDGFVTGDLLEKSAGGLVRRDDILVIRDDSHKTSGQSCDACFSVDAAHWLLAKGVKMLVHNGIRAGRTVPDDREFHDILLGRDIPIIHSAANLERLPRPEFYVIAWPVKFHGLDSVWVRLAAIVER